MLKTALFVFAASVVAMTSADRATWGDHQMVVHQLPVDAKPTSAIHSELFMKTPRGANDFVASGGTFLETAGSGSTWVYDPAHHIVALSEHGDVTGDQIWYGNAPPFPVKQRDLSTVASPDGVHLGMSPAAAITILALPPSAVRALPNGNRFISTAQILQIIQTGGGAERVRDNNIVFDHGRAIWIELDDVCC